MSLQTHLDRMRFIDDLIRRRATGDLESLCKKLGLSRSHTLEYLKELKENGFPIKYSRSQIHYYYSEDGELVKDLFVKKLRNTDRIPQAMSRHDLRKISGGQTFFKFFAKSDYIRLKDLNFVNERG